ncbi:MAG: hypothetical protein ISQ13_01655 [Candidatus Margulisbacteria bacterium]|nr:hypothetical protein [Candidatus Margulisiibacteriota bacterium]
MRFSFLSLYADAVATFFNRGILHRAIDAGVISLSAIQWRNYASPPHFSVDDAPFSNKKGMLLRYDVLHKALSDAPSDAVFVMPDPKGPPFNHQHAQRLCQHSHVFFISPAYEGVDARIHDAFPIQQYSLGDFIIPNGDSACMIMAEAIARYIPGVVGNGDCIEDDSILSGLLECPQFTAPRRVDQFDVPEVLLSGHHHHIQTWKMMQSLRQTLFCRPDLLNRFSFDKTLVKMIDQIIMEEAA